MSKQPMKAGARSQALETIDPTALAQVSGGKAREASGGGDSDAIMSALSGILGELSALAKSNAGGGISAQDVMLMMMVMQQRQGAPVVAAPPQPANWTWDANGGYWIVK